MKASIKATLWAALSLGCITVTGQQAHAQAQSYELIRVDSGLTGTYVSSFGRGGFGAVVEPKLLVHDRVGVGARFEAAVMFGGNIDTGGEDVAMDMAAAGSGLLKGEYYFTDGGARPFAGLGLGMYSIAAQSVGAGSGDATVHQQGGRYFGMAPQVGIDLGRVRLAATYNAILGAEVEVTQTVGEAEQRSTFRQDYLTVELSFRFGGQRKAAPASDGEMISAR